MVIGSFRAVLPVTRRCLAENRGVGFLRRLSLDLVDRLLGQLGQPLRVQAPIAALNAGSRNDRRYVVGVSATYARAMKSNEPVRVTEHLHTDVRDVAARTQRFGSATHDTQLRVLKELRMDVAIDSTQPTFTVAALFLAFVAIVVPPAASIDFQESPWWVTLVVSSVAVVLLAVVLLVALSPLLRQHGRQAVATVWLAAYEDEISRWRSLDTREGKAWRRTH